MKPRRDAIYATKKRCNLCNKEKKPYPHIYTSSSSKSGHGELISTSRHRRKYLLSSIEQNEIMFYMYLIICIVQLNAI